MREKKKKKKKKTKHKVIIEGVEFELCLCNTE